MSVVFCLELIVYAQVIGRFLSVSSASLLYELQI